MNRRPHGLRSITGSLFVWQCSAPYPSFVEFDVPSCEVCTEKCSRANTPVQPLATLNDPAFVRAAATLAGRILDESIAAVEDRAIQIRRTDRTILSASS
jgi:hypothetical protein